MHGIANTEPYAEISSLSTFNFYNLGKSDNGIAHIFQNYLLKRKLESTASSIVFTTF